MRRLIVVFVCASLSSSANSVAQSTPSQPRNSTVRREVLAAEGALERALIKMDQKALDSLYAADLESRHWSGARDTKQSWLGFIVDSITYKRHTPHIDHMEFYPNTVWVSGTMISESKLRGTASFETEALAFGHLWVNEDGRWRLREQAGRKAQSAKAAP